MGAIVLGQDMRIPEVADLPSFCEWSASSDFPSKGRYSYLRGEIWVDLSMERFFTHNQVKAEISEILRRLVKSDRSGYFSVDGMLLSNEAADLATEPDGMFISFAAIEADRAQFDPGVGQGQRIVAGAPDMVLEVVSDNSVQKDTVELMHLYWLAGVPEYWLVDARADALRFDILKRGAKGYHPTRRLAGGWLKSAVFARAFRLTQQPDRLGHPQFTLEVR